MLEIEISNHSHTGDRDLKLGAETINQPSGVKQSTNQSDREINLWTCG